MYDDTMKRFVRRTLLVLLAVALWETFVVVAFWEWAKAQPDLEEDAR